MSRHQLGVCHRFAKCVRFRLRTILLLMAVLCVVLSWGRERYLRAMRLREAVALIRSESTLGIRYEHELEQSRPISPYTSPLGGIMESEPPRPRWLSPILGDEYFLKPVKVVISGEDVVDRLDLIVDGMPWLREVIIFGRAPTKRQAQHLRRLRDLSWITIRESKTVADEALVEISRIEALRRLEITDCDKPVYRALQDLDRAETKITDLKLAGTQLTDDALQCVPLLPSLRSLELQNCYLTNDAIPFLAQWKHLGRLKLDLTALPPDRIDELRAALPDTSITYIDDGIRK